MISTSRNYGLDFARALAIMLALFIHLYDYFIRVDIGEMWYLGYFAMDIFFALSGFLIGGILIKLFDVSNGAITFSQIKIFLFRRWFRTVPLYYLLLFVNFFSAKYILHTTAKFDFRYFLWLQNIAHLPPGFFGESWSLSVEEWFYFSFSAGLFIFCLLTVKWKVKPVNKILAFTSGYILLFNFLRVCYASYDYNEYNIVLFRLDATAYGVLMAVLYRYYYAYFKSRIILTGITGLLVSAIGVLLFLLKPKIGRIYILYYPFIGTGLSLCMVFLKEWSSISKMQYGFKTINLISRVSYSLYLVNMLVILLLLHFFVFDSYVKDVAGMLAAFIIICIISGVTYKFVEQPFLKIRDQFFSFGKEKKDRKVIYNP